MASYLRDGHAECPFCGMWCKVNRSGRFPRHGHRHRAGWGAGGCPIWGAAHGKEACDRAREWLAEMANHTKSDKFEEKYPGHRQNELSKIDSKIQQINDWEIKNLEQSS